ncbi:MAG TPA: hypothetical protein PLA50_02035, partial [Bacteroidia bacterium]|nr:hypothetical protein [Bacteroidia bacterium]
MMASGQDPTMQDREPDGGWCFHDRRGRRLSSLDQYPDGRAFLIASGPSFGLLDHGPLRQPGILTMGVNNSPATFRPDLWVGVDPPRTFLKSIWLDPKIAKYVRVEHLDRAIFDSRHWMPYHLTPRDCPRVTAFTSSDSFCADRFLNEATVAWGDAVPDGHQARSVLLAALKILYCLGIREVFLLGVDFHMEPSQPYHFAESVTEPYVAANQKAYAKLARQLQSLVPYFAEHGYQVWNCNPDSKLEVFPHLPLAEAIRRSLKDFPPSDQPEPTAGLYQREDGVNDSMEPGREPVTAIGKTAAGLRRVDRSKRSVATRLEPLGEVEAPDDSGLVVMSDGESEWLLPWFASRFQRHHPTLPVCLFDLGMSDGALRWAGQQGWEIRARTWDDAFGTAWFHKPLAIEASPFTNLLFLDLDCEVRGALNDALQWCQDGLVLGQDLHPPNAYGKLFRRDHFYNSGLIAVRRDHPVIALWRDAVRELHQVMRGDQEILNLTIQEHEIPVLVL